MSLRRLVLIFGALFYVFLWVLVANGVTSLEAPLVIPVVLALLVYLGLLLNRFLGLRPREQHFQEPPNEKKQ